MVNVPASDLRPHLDAFTVPGQWWHATPDNGRIVCDLCPRACSLKPGDQGFCFVRENRGGQMVLTTYGRSTGFCIDPIEKKPLNHFFPGTSVLSFGTAGCNLGCKFCQNWDISKSREVARLSERAEPAAIAAAAQALGCRSVAFTYNDPVIWAEYAIDTAKACRAAGVKTVAVTAGYITPPARAEFYEHIDAANVDLKAFSEDFYWKLTQSHLQPVLDTLLWLRRQTNVWFEITNLVIPRANDTPEELQRMCRWVLDELGDDVPVHFTAFHPDFRLTDRPRTPPETLLAAHEIARREGLKYVYVGNVHDVPHQSTYCPACGRLLIERDWYALGQYNLKDARCGHCGAAIAGRFDPAGPGHWGQRREPVDMQRFAGATPVVEAAPSADPAPAPLPVPAAKPMSNPTATAHDNPGNTASAALELSGAQREAIHRAAAEWVTAQVAQRPPQLADETLLGAAPLEVWGAYVTLKRRGQLRGCCGLVGRAMPLGQSVAAAAARTAAHDPRVPPVTAGELAFLDLDVTLLHTPQRIEATGHARLAQIEVGRHGLQLRRGAAGGLFLPAVAREHGWDAETLLRELCVKAGLPTTAWKQDDVELWSFEGQAVGGPLAHEQTELPSDAPLPLAARDVADLAEHCRQNLIALATGAVACYYLPGGADGNVSGVLLSLLGPDGQELVRASRIALREELPLQSTAYQLVETMVASLGVRRIRVDLIEPGRVALAVLTATALHGRLAEPDLRGIDPARRAVVVGARGQLAWAFDPAQSAAALLDAAAAQLAIADRQHAQVSSLATVATAPKFSGSTAPTALRGPAARPPAVAGMFYPGEPAEMNRELDELYARADRSLTRPWPAAMVPHAGWKYSGHIAAATLSRVEIPDSVIVIGPKHTRLGMEWAVAPNEIWQLPGTFVAGDPELAARLAAAIDGLALDGAAHAQEHGIEVELPLIARLNPQARVVGIALGAATWEQCQRFAAGLAQVTVALDTAPLLLISSDMNHFARDAENRELDQLALAAMERRDPEHLLSTVRQQHISMCGVVPAVIVMETLRQLGQLKSIERVAYGTSADVTGDTSRVVGYAGMLLG